MANAELQPKVFNLTRYDVSVQRFELR